MRAFFAQSGRTRPGRWFAAMLVSAAVGVFAVASGAPATTPAPSWPQFGFDPGGARFNPRERTLSPSTVGSLREVWQHDIGGDIWSSAAVASGVVYIGESHGNVCALRAGSGSAIWCRRVVGAPAAPAIVANRLIVRTSSSLLYALDRTTGRVIWRLRIGELEGAFPPAVTVSGQMAFVNSGEDAIAVDTRTGKIVWLRPVGCFSCPVTTDGTTVFVPTGGESGDALRAYRRTDGKLRWSVPMSRSANDGAAVAAGAVYLLEIAWDRISIDKTYAFTARAAGTGRLLWETQLGAGKYLTFGMPSIAYGSVFAAVPDGTLRAFDSTTGMVRWSTPLPATDSSPAVANGVVYAAADGTLYALSAADGTTLWSGPIAPSSSSPAVADGTVYIGDDNGVVHAFRAAG